MNHRQDKLMGREVGRIAFQLGQALGCSTCGIGKAIDVVGQRWGLVPYDWAGEEAKKVGHRCNNTTWAGPDAVRPVPGTLVVTDAEKNRRTAEISAQLEAWARENTDLGLMGDEHLTVDSRLPVERDDEPFGGQVPTP